MVFVGVALMECEVARVHCLPPFVVAVQAAVSADALCVGDLELIPVVGDLACRLRVVRVVLSSTEDAVCKETIRKG